MNKITTTLMAIIAIGILWGTFQKTASPRFSGHVDDGIFIILNNNTGEVKV